MTKITPSHPPLRDAQNLLNELDKLAARRPADNPVLPPVLFMNNASADMSVSHLIPNYFWTSANAKHPTIPHVLSILDEPDRDDLALFEHIYDNFKLPKSMGRISFPNLKMAKDILGITLNSSATDHDAKITDLTKQLYRKQRIKSSEVIPVNAGYDGWLGVLAIGLELWRRIRFRIFRTKLATTPQYRWFCDRVALELTAQNQADEIPEDFLGCAIWTLKQPETKKSDLTRELLMLALFEDLERAFESHTINLSLLRRRRCTPFIITFKDVKATDSAARRFLQTYGEVMDQSKGAALLILASINGAAPPSLQADSDTFTSAAEKLNLIRHGRYESSAITAFNVSATASSEQAELIQQFVANRPTPEPKTTLRDFTFLVVFAAILAPPLLAGLIFFIRNIPVLYQSTQRCNYMHSVKDVKEEVIGITDGSCSFLTSGDNRATRYAETKNPLLRHIKIGWGQVTAVRTYIWSLGKNSPHPLSAERLRYIHELGDTQRIILAQNQAVKATDASRTIVLLIPFTAPDESGHINQKTIGILRGAAVAQQEINANAEHAPVGSTQHLKLKYLLANAGDKLMHGETVAKDVRTINANGAARLAPRHTIVAVAGITQSLAKAKDTTNALTQQNSSSNNPPIPVVGSTLTYDHMSGNDPLFYQASASNRRQAQVLAEFVRQQPLVGDVSSINPTLLKPARNVIIISDNNDWYSQNLADDLYGQFTTSTAAKNRTVLGNWSLTGGDPEDSDDEVKYPTTPLSLTGVQGKLCGPDLLAGFDQQKDILMYTGRSQNFSTFLGSLKPDVCPSGKGFTIVTGSDMAQWGEYDAFKNFFPHLYFAAYGARNSDHNGAVADSFFANPTVKDIVDQSGGARAYDSIKLAWNMVNDVTVKLQNPDNKELELPSTTDMVRYVLQTPPLQTEGASGVITIPDGLQVPINRPVFVMRAGQSQPVLSCGSFSIQPAGSPTRLNTHGQPFTETKWGSNRQFDCPTE